MVSFAGLDWAIIGLFVALALGLGFSAKLREHSALQFIAAGRRLTLPLFLATLVATWYGGILGIGESVLYYGVGTLLLLGIPYYIFALLYAWLYAKRVREADQISIPERLFEHFGKGASLVGAVLVFVIGVPSAHVLMLGVLTQTLTGWSLPLACLVAAVVGTLFLYRGGLMADARMSILAFAMMYIGFAVISLWCLTHYPAMETWQAAGQPPEWLSFTGGQGPIVIISFIILGAWTLIDPGFHQRAASAESPKTSQRGILLAVAFWMLFDAMTITTGLYAVSLMPELPENGLMIFPLFGSQILPAGLKAVFFCGMLGTILSALVGYSLVSGSTLGREMICRLKPELDATTWTRVGIGIGTVAAIGIALSIKSVVNIWYAVGGGVTGALLLPVSISYGLIRWRGGSGPVIASMVLSALVAFGWLGYGLATGNDYLMVTLPERILGYNLPQALANSAFSLGTLLPGLAVSALVLGVSSIFRRPK